MIRITESMDSPKSWLSIEVTLNDGSTPSINNHAIATLNRSSSITTATGQRMEVPRFPAPPPLRSISLDISEHHRPPSSMTLTNRRFYGGCNPSEVVTAARRRARSASWLVARSKQQLIVPASSRRRVRPIEQQQLATIGNDDNKTRGRLAAELGFRSLDDGGYTGEKLSRTEEEDSGGEEEEEEDRRIGGRSARALERIREDKTPKKMKENCVSEESDIICYSTAEANDEKQQDANDPIIREPLSQRKTQLTPIQGRTPSAEDVLSLAPVVTSRRKNSRWKSAGMQTHNQVLYRLRIFPTLRDIAHEGKDTYCICRCIRFLGRLALCQFGLAWLLTIWALLGATAFYITEGPRERQQVVELKNLQRDLIVNLATELRQLKNDDKETEPLWSQKILHYFQRHEKLLLLAVSSGYGEGGQSGQLWTFPGCVLFSVSVLTTLGFGAPVPRTSAGRTVTVLFGLIGIPAHFLLVLNVGLMLAMRLKRYGILRSYRDECQNDPLVYDYLPMPMWVKVTPFLGMGAYYTLGIIGFGFARLQPVSESLLFPLDFTAAGGLSTITGHIRVFYGLYLEGAVTLAAFAVAVLKVSATQSLTNIGLKYGLLIPA